MAMALPFRLNVSVKIWTGFCCILTQFFFVCYCDYENIKIPAYGQNSALSYVCVSGVPILYHESKSIPWVLFIL